MPKYTFVTSFSDKLWKAYASNTVPTVYRNLPDGIQFIVYFNGEFQEEWKLALPEAEFRDLNAMSDYQFFRQKYKKTPLPNVEKGHQFRFNFLPFWNKVCALQDAMVKGGRGKIYEDYLIWLDADLFSAEEITEDDLERWIQGKDVASLTRSQPWNTWETGFLSFKMSDLTKSFVDDVYKLYTSGRLFDHNEWHDAYLFTVVWKEYKTKLSHNELNLVPSYGHCFDTSILPPSLCHLKGGERKMTGKFFEHPKANAVLFADFTGVRNVKEDPVISVNSDGVKVHV